MPQQKIYADKDLIKYEDTIRLHFDQQGKTAWLKLENYGSAGRHLAEVQRVTVGTKVQQAYKDTISIGGMLSCAHINGFQRAVIAQTTGKQSFSRKELTNIVAASLKTLGFHVQRLYDVGEKDPNFYFTTLAALDEILKQPPGDRNLLSDISDLTKLNGLVRLEHPDLGDTSPKMEAFKFTAYFPRPDLRYQEQRTQFTDEKQWPDLPKQGVPMEMGQGPGKTNPHDPRELKPIFGKLGHRFGEKAEAEERQWEKDTEWKQGEYEFDEFIKRIDKQIIKLIPGKKALYLDAKKRGVEVNFLHQNLKRISCYAFRGDSRSPLKIRGTNPEPLGFLAGVTRKEPGIERATVKGFASLGNWKSLIKSFGLGQKLPATETPVAEVLALINSKKQEDYAFVMCQLMHLGAFTADQTFRGYISFTKSMAIAKAFANAWEKWDPNVKVYCYAAFCRGGFELPSHNTVECKVKTLGKTVTWISGPKFNLLKAGDDILIDTVVCKVEKIENNKSLTCDKDLKKKNALAKYTVTMEAQHEFTTYYEQEVAMPGAVWWEPDVVGWRVIQCARDGQRLTGPVFLQDRLKEKDDKAFSELFELFSGKNQGERGEIYKQYPNENRPDSSPLDIPPDKIGTQPNPRPDNPLGSDALTQFEGQIADYEKDPTPLRLKVITFLLEALAADISWGSEGEKVAAMSKMNYFLARKMKTPTMTNLQTKFVNLEGLKDNPLDSDALKQFEGQIADYEKHPTPLSLKVITFLLEALAEEISSGSGEEKVAAISKMNYFLARKMKTSVMTNLQTKFANLEGLKG